MIIMFTRFSKAVKKLVTNDEHEKLKEEMAWQVAEMIVRDVTRSDSFRVLIVLQTFILQYYYAG